MKNAVLSLVLLSSALHANSQIGIGTTVPNSTLDVRGSLSTSLRSFTANTSALISDNTLVFTGTTAVTLTLPTAASIAGRTYRVKNASTTLPSPIVTIATTGGQTIDGMPNWSLTDQYQTVTLVSNGTNWSIVSFLPSSSSVSWSQTGNSNTNAATNFLGTTDDKPLIFKSFSESFLEFGRRQTLGLTQPAYSGYDDGDEKVTYVRSALQFEATNAQFYKPKMFTDADGNFRMIGASAGTDYFEFGATGSNNNGGFEFIIGDDGDEPMVFKSKHYLNGTTEIMRLQSGRMAVGSNAFSASNPEKLLIDAGVTGSYNLMTGKGSIDNYLQINVQNRSNGTSASSDLVATADNGTENVNYIDMGVNSSLYNYTAIPVLNGANNTYVYGAGNDFTIGNVGNNKPLIFFTNATGTVSNAAERMRITGSGNVGIGNNAPNSNLSVTGSLAMTYYSGTGNYTVKTTDYVVINTGGAATWTLPAANSCAGRIYRLVNQGTANMTISPAVRTASGTTLTTLGFASNANFFEIISDGTEWRRIN